MEGLTTFTEAGQGCPGGPQGGKTTDTEAIPAG